MLRSVETPSVRSRITMFERLRRTTRRVQVEVFIWGLVADRFLASNPATIKSEVARVYKHLPETGGSVRITGVEQSSLPFGIAPDRRVVALDNLESALLFLEG